MRSAVLLGLLLSTPALAEEPLTAEAFDALTLGRTMTWAEFGQVYGVEQYLPGRRVRWTVVGDDCKLGHWYPEGEMICFQYEDDPEPDCWTITPGSTGLDARYAGTAADSAPVLVQETTEPMACFGPKVGA